MKQKKSLLILCGICLILIVVYIALEKYNENVELEESVASMIESIEDTSYITDIDSSEVVTISWKYYEQEFEFELVGEEWVYTTDEEFPLDSSYMTSLMNTYCSLTAVRQLGEGDELSAYGLEEPECYVILEQASGEVTTYYIGDINVEDDYYLTIDDKAEVYTVSYTVLSVIANELMDLILVDTFPSITADELTEVIIIENGAETSYTSNEAGEFDTIVSGIEAISFDTCVAYNVGDSLAEYGLDEENRITLEFQYEVLVESEEDTEDEEDTAETTVVNEIAILYIGSYDDISGSYYVQVEDSDIVYSMSADTIALLMNE